MKMANLYNVTQILLNSVAGILTKTVNMDDTNIEKLMERFYLKIMKYWMKSETELVQN